VEIQFLSSAGLADSDRNTEALATYTTGSSGPRCRCQKTSWAVFWTGRFSLPSSKYSIMLSQRWVLLRWRLCLPKLYHGPIWKPGKNCYLCIDTKLKYRVNTCGKCLQSRLPLIEAVSNDYRTRIIKAKEKVIFTLCTITWPRKHLDHPRRLWHALSIRASFPPAWPERASKSTQRSRSRNLYDAKNGWWSSNSSSARM